MLTLEDKKRICARLFFTDNEDQYEDYHEALAEFMSGENVTETFVDFAVQSAIQPEEGHDVYTNKGGHVATVRLDDGFFSFRTEMTDDEVEEARELWEKAREENPEVGDISVLLEKAGWKKI